MTSFVLLIALFSYIVLVENKMRSRFMSFPLEHWPYIKDSYELEDGNEREEGVNKFDDREDRDDSTPDDETMFMNQPEKKPCSVIVVPNAHDQNMQTLVRKYRYSANGLLIPDSVKYYLKIPQGDQAPILFPLKEKTITPMGGFVRYYKEVPSIPRLWQQ